MRSKVDRYRWEASSQFVDIVDIYTHTKEAPPPGGVDIARVSRYPMLRADCAGWRSCSAGPGPGRAMQHKASPWTEWELQEKGKSGLWKKGLKMLRLLVTRHHMMRGDGCLFCCRCSFHPRPRHRHRPLCSTARTFAGDFPSLQSESRDFITPTSSYHLIRCSSSSVLPHFYVCRSKTWRYQYFIFFLMNRQKVWENIYSSQ